MKTIHYSIIVSVGIIASIVVGLYVFIVPDFVFSTTGNTSCSPAPNVSMKTVQLKQITWLSVIEIEKNQTKLDCTIVNPETFSHIPKLEQILSGADQCKQGQNDLCSFSSGASVTMISDGIIPVNEHENYQSSLTRNEAIKLLDMVKLSSNGNLVVGDVEYNNKYYQIILFTSDTPNSPQVTADYAIEPSSIPVDLVKGESVNYTITVKTLATFGDTAKVQLYPIIRAQDSDLTARIIPDLLLIPERSQANATLVITSGSHAQNGTYEIGFDGKLQSGAFAGGMRQTNCPCIRIGHSDWTITTYGGDSGGWGGKSPPPWLKVETITDKRIYQTGEPIKITNFIINDNPNKITLDGNVRLFVTVYNQVNGTGAHRYFYGIDAMHGEKPIVLEPHSKTLIARPFYWDQNVVGTDSIAHAVIPADYRIDASFGSYNGEVWDNDIPITIK